MSDATGAAGASRRGAVVAIIAIVALFLVAAIVGEAGKLDTSGLRLSVPWVLLSVVGFLGFHLAHAMLWRRQLAALGAPLRPMRALAVWSASLVARYVPTGMLMPAVRIAMAADRGVPKRVSTAAVVYEAALTIAGALVLAAYLLVSLPDLEGHTARWLILVAPFAALLSTHPRVFGPVARTVLVKAKREPLQVALNERQVVGFTTLYFLSFVLAGASFWALCHGLTTVGPGDLPLLLGAYSVGFVAAVLAFVLPAGLGAREAAIVVALAPVLPAGQALAVAVASRLIQLAIEVVLALLAPVLADARAS